MDSGRELSARNDVIPDAGNAAGDVSRCRVQFQPGLDCLALDEQAAFVNPAADTGRGVVGKPEVQPVIWAVPVRDRLGFIDLAPSAEHPNFAVAEIVAFPNPGVAPGVHGPLGMPALLFQLWRKPRIVAVFISTMQERGGVVLRKRLSTGDPSIFGFQITQISDFGARIVGSSASSEYSGTSSASSTMHRLIPAVDLMELMPCRNPFEQELRAAGLAAQISIPTSYAAASHGSDAIAFFSSAWNDSLMLS